MAYTVFKTNLAQSAANAAGNIVAAQVAATGELKADAFTTVFDGIYAKLEAIYDADQPAKEAGTTAVKQETNRATASNDPGSTVFNFGAVKGLTVAEVGAMSAADLKAHGEKLVDGGWQGSAYEKGGDKYLEYVANTTNAKLSFMKKVVSQYLDSKRA